MKYNRILCLSDLHFPFHHRDTFTFLKAIIKEYKLDFWTPDSGDLAVLLGDEIEGKCINFHEGADPDLPYSASSELQAAKKCIKKVYDLIPHAYVLESNHGSLVFRRGKWAKLPRMVFKTYQEILETPYWNWVPKLIVHCGNVKVLFNHGKSARPAAYSKSTNCCTVEGHYHTKFCINFWKGIDQQMKWGMNVGCMIDNKSLAFFYNKTNLDEPNLGHGIIINGIPYLLPMGLTRGGRWDGVVP